MKSQLIGFTGPAGSGKDTAANILVQSKGYIKFSFAAALKDILAVIFNWDRSLLEGDTEESRAWRDKEDVFWSEKLNTKFTPRIAMQTIGTDLFRKHFNDEIWVLSLENKLASILSTQKVIISDVRFPNEIKLVRSFGGEIFEVQGPEKPEYYDLARMLNVGNAPLDELKVRFPDLHESEYAWIGLNEPDHLIPNNSTVEALEAYMTGLMAQPKYQ